MSIMHLKISDLCAINIVILVLERVMKVNYKLLKFACYTVSITMAFTASLPPLLFLTFRTLYDISYSLLGLLVVINFVTQLCIDLVFSFFSHKFDIPLTVRIMPMLAIIGFLIFVAVPTLAPSHAYLGLALGTVIFSASSGLAEVLISPIIASIPSDDPDRQMSALHSVFAWGSAAVVVLSTLFLLVVGTDNWAVLVLIFLIVPILSTILFCRTGITCVPSHEKGEGISALFKSPVLWLCVFAIFLGGASELAMSQWASTYIENVLSINKVWGDMLGVAMFEVSLGLGRTLYAKFGKNLTRVLILGSIGAALCYLTAAISSIKLLGLVACALTGICVSMMWPGTLSIASERFKAGGVVVFALMAAGGDMGAAVAPQLVGIVTDFAIKNKTLVAIADTLSLSPDGLGLKIGMLVGMLFPLIAIFVYASLHKIVKR